MLGHTFYHEKLEGKIPWRKKPFWCKENGFHGKCYKNIIHGKCKVEFIQLLCWLYFVPNLLVIQHLETLYLGGNHVRVVCERV